MIHLIQILITTTTPDRTLPSGVSPAPARTVWAFGIFGITLALLSRNASESKEKHFSRQATVGIILSVIALALTFFICFILMKYYDALRDPVLGPYLNELYNQVMDSMSGFYNFPSNPQ